MTTAMVTHGHDDETALVPTSTGALSPMVDSPLPVFTGAQMIQALTAYRELQNALDRQMPEQIMKLDGKAFRKKGYWRAIAVAFGLKVEPIAERREISGHFNDGRENFGYVVEYRAAAPNGRSVSGDGACFAIEKARRFKCPHPERPGSKRTLHFPHNTCPDFDADFQWRVLPADATEHNVRSHAHTRAYNRAVSNLVGFGEVSAEEVNRDETNGDETHPPVSQPAVPPVAHAQAHAEPSRREQAAAPPRREPPATGGPVISEPQAKRFYAIARNAGLDDGGKAWLKARGINSDREIPKSRYEALCTEVARGDRQPGEDG